MSVTTAHVNPRMLFHLILSGDTIPEQIAADLVIFPDYLDWLLYMGTHMDASAGHSTIPDETGRGKRWQVVNAQMHAAQDDAFLVQRDIHPDITFSDGLKLLAESLVLVRERGNLLWYPKENLHRWLLQMSKDPYWWTTLLRAFPNSTFPRNPGRLSYWPQCPRTWSKALQLYAGVHTSKVPPQTILGRHTADEVDLPLLHSLSA
jgi:hypothetical protein